MSNKKVKSNEILRGKDEKFATCPICSVSFRFSHRPEVEVICDHCTFWLCDRATKLNEFRRKMSIEEMKAFYLSEKEKGTLPKWVI